MNDKNENAIKEDMPKKKGAGERKEDQNGKVDSDGNAMEVDDKLIGDDLAIEIAEPHHGDKKAGSESEYPPY